MKKVLDRYVLYDYHMREMHNRYGSFSGKRMRKAREAANMSRTELSRYIGFIVGPESIGHYEKGYSCPRFDAALRIANALGIDLEDLTDAPC